MYGRQAAQAATAVHVSLALVGLSIALLRVHAATALRSEILAAALAQPSCELQTAPDASSVRASFGYQRVKGDAGLPWWQQQLLGVQLVLMAKQVAELSGQGAARPPDPQPGVVCS